MTKTENTLALLFLLFLGLMPLIAVETPRFLALGPGLTGVVFFALYTFMTQKRPPLHKPALLISLCIIALSGLSIMWSLDTQVSLERTVKLCSVLLPGILLLGTARHIPAGVLKPYLWILPRVLVVAAALIVFETLMDSPLYRLIRGLGPTDEFSDSIFNRAVVTSLLCAFAGYHMLKQSTASALPKIAFILAIGALFLITKSQSAQLGLLVALPVAAFFPYQRKKAWYALALIIAALIFAAPFISIWLFQNTAETLNTIPVTGFGYGHAGDRLEIWDFISRYTLKNPLLGHGIEATKTIADFDAAQIYYKSTSVLHPHNFALQLWIEFGVIGALAGALFCSYILITMQKHLTPAQCRITLPTFMAALSIAATGYGMWQSWWLGLLLLVTALCMLAVKTVDDS